MKKFCLFFALFCLSIQSFGQFTATAVVPVVGAAGSYKTGYTQSSTGRTDGNMVVAATGTATRGYAVFTISGAIPGGSTVDSVYLRFNFTTANTSVSDACGIYGIATDLSTVTSPSTLYVDCANGSSFNSTNWGASSTGTQVTLPLNAAGIAFVQANLASVVSLGFTTTSGVNTFTITGEGGTSATTPELIIKYHCTGVSGLSASATPNPVCSGSNFSLHGAGLGGSAYLWSGPAAYGSTLLNPGPITATTSTAGTYSLTIYNSGGCGTSVSTSVVVNPLPNSITGPTSVCSGASVSFTDSAAGGGWTSTPGTLGSISGAGVFTASPATGTANITYTLPTGCSISTTLSVIANPAVITGPSSVCGLSTAYFADISTPGTWSMTPVSTESISTGGLVTAGLTAGTAIITFTNTSGCYTTKMLTILPLPSAITGSNIVCSGSTTSLFDSTAGGSWTCTPTAIATVGGTTGVVAGHSFGTATVTYTGPNTCQVTSPVYVAIVPPDTISGVFSVCPILTTTLADATPAGFWACSSPSASVNSTGVVRGLAAGTALVTYYNGCGLRTQAVNVRIPPAPISGALNVCVGSITSLTDDSTGGYWSSSNSTIALAAAGFGTMTGVAQGTVTVTYTAPTSCIDTQTFVVNPVPAAITGTAHTCPGQTLNLSESTPGGFWSSSNSGIANVTATGMVTGMSSGNAVITYMIPSTGCQATFNMLVNPNPALITGRTVVCFGLSDTMYCITPGGVWSSSPAGIAYVNSSNGIITGVGAGLATISYTISTGCFQTRPIDVQALPSPVITYNSGTNTLSVPNLYTSYQWYRNGLILPGANSWNLAGPMDAWYSIFVVDGHGCQNMSAIYTIVNVGVPLVSADELQVYPNPSTGLITIKSSIVLHAVVLSMNGSTLIDKANADNLDLSAYPFGTYLLNLYDDAGKLVATQRIVKQ